MCKMKSDRSSLTKYIKSISSEAGFLDCGISAATYLEDEAHKMECWLDNNYQAEMHYLERNNEKRYDPRKLVDGAKSVITFLHNYYTDVRISESSYGLSKYAYGEDYHHVIKDKLFGLLSKIKDQVGEVNARVFVDSAPVLERSWAMRSGLGFIGKNTMLISRKAGSYIFIGSIVVDIELDYDAKIERNYCGNCTACIDACPNQAITADGVDSNKCISYLTIEHKGDFKNPVNLDNWIYGCDICQQVCPWNKFAHEHNEPLFVPSVKLKEMNDEKWHNLSAIEFGEIFKKSAVKRTGFKGVIRNIAAQ